MSLFRRKQREREDAARDEERAQVAEKVDEITERGARAAEALRERRRRNHWGETIATIARGGHP